MWRFLQPYFRSDQPYAIRFAVVMSLMYFIDEHYIEQLFRRYDAINNATDSNNIKCLKGV